MDAPVATPPTPILTPRIVGLRLLAIWLAVDWLIVAPLLTEQHYWPFASLVAAGQMSAAATWLAAGCGHWVERLVFAVMLFVGIVLSLIVLERVVPQDHHPYMLTPVLRQFTWVALGHSLAQVVILRFTCFAARIQFVDRAAITPEAFSKKSSTFSLRQLFALTTAAALIVFVLTQTATEDPGGGLIVGGLLLQFFMGPLGLLTLAGALRTPPRGYLLTLGIPLALFNVWGLLVAITTRWEHLGMLVITNCLLITYPLVYALSLEFWRWHGYVLTKISLGDAAPHP